MEVQDLTFCWVLVQIVDEDKHLKANTGRVLLPFLGSSSAGFIIASDYPG